MIKRTKVPVICICNDRQHPKIRSLANYCLDLRFQKPRVNQIRGALMSVCFKEGIKAEPNALSEVILASGQDIRQVRCVCVCVCVCMCVCLQNITEVYYDSTILRLLLYMHTHDEDQCPGFAHSFLGIAHEIVPV